MSFSAQMTRCPRAYDPDRGHETRLLFPDQNNAIGELIEGAAGCSPYLHDLMAKETSWLNAAFGDIDAAVGEEIASLYSLSIAELPAGLRSAKRRVALAAALADLSGVWSLEQVTAALTELADAAVHSSLVGLTRQALEAVKLPMFGPDDIETACGITALAMGKIGAGELNYSSDIDLICLFDETRLDPDDYQRARPVFIKIVRAMAKMLNDRTSDGYVFRTDLRLRPDASVTPVCLSMEAAERYYESVGRTWERAAYIKARACAGDITAGDRFLNTLTPFVWRKHLDFAAIQDAHDIRLKIREHKGLHGPITLSGHNMKLGRGGIREIEFFTQTRQLIAGGRETTLRERATVAGLQALAQKDWVTADLADELTGHYRFHREIEHRLQMVNDAQTHDLPNTEAGFNRIAALMGRDAEGLKSELYDRLSAVHDRTEGFFAPSDIAEQSVPSFGSDITDRWPTYPALRSERAAQVFERITPVILGRIEKAARPSDALVGFDMFLQGLPAGAQLFSLFETNPQIIDLLLDIAAISPELSQYLSRNASVLDAVIAGDFFDPWPDTESLVVNVNHVINRAQDYEGKLDALRRWMKEAHFRIGVHHLRGLISPQTASNYYATLAQAVVTAIWPVVVDEFARKYGTPPGRGAMVLGMGSLGAGRLSATSDLDLIVIYDAQGVDASDGPRSLASRVYFARLTQAFITALTVPMAEGRLYEVDMRLRPSGRQGPVAISFDGFKDYQRTEAWTWEHLALTRGRPIAGDSQLSDEVDAFRAELLLEKSKGAGIAQDLSDMRRRIASAKSDPSPFATKIGQGRLQDIELCAQTLALWAGSPERGTLAQLKAGVASGRLQAADAQCLGDSYRLLWAAQVTMRLLTKDPFDAEKIGTDGMGVLLRDSGYAGIDALVDAMRSAAMKAAKVISSVLEAGQ